MTRFPLAALLAALTVTPAAAQEGWGIAADIGLGAEVEPDWLGSKDMETSPWVIFRNVDLTRPGQAATADGSADGLRVLPTLNWRGGREADDSDALTGLDDIDGTVEAGVKFRYTRGPATAQLIVRKGFGGHDGLVGSVGGKYRTAPNDRLTLWPGIEAKFGDDSFTQTYFGVTADESARSGYAAYSPQGGIYAAGFSLEGRYAVTDSLAVVGEVEYSKLVGDAADSPFVEDTSQPALRLGIVHRFDLRF